MRQNARAEELTIKAIKLCISNGFKVKVQTQVHLKNIDSMFPTAKMLNDLGVNSMRIIRTTEAPRWEQTNPNTSISFEDYYEKMLDFASDYMNANLQMSVDIWQYIILFPELKSYYLTPIRMEASKFNVRMPVCKDNRGMIGISSSGEVVPCLQMSGYFIEHGISLANVFRAPLKEIVSSSDYLEHSLRTLYRFIENNDKCPNCKYIKVCTGGCPALGTLYSGDKIDFYHEDITKCLFYFNGWYDKICNRLSKWHLMNPLVLDNDDK